MASVTAAEKSSLMLSTKAAAGVSSVYASSCLTGAALFPMAVAQAGCDGLFGDGFDSDEFYPKFIQSEIILPKMFIYIYIIC